MKPEDTPEEIKGSYRVAITYYNKALLALKMIFEQEYQGQHIVLSMSESTDLIKNVEIPVCLNLGLCYMKTEQYHYAIKYCTQVIEKNIPDKYMAQGTLEKAYYRRGSSYFSVGDLAKAKEDLVKANELADGKNGSVLTALKQLKAKYEENR